jgi:DNA-binding winged helix-turn-helix (wHTH) protein
MPADIYRFADFELDRSAYQLRRKGRPARIERIPLDLLFLLAEKPGQLVTRDEIRERIWGKAVFWTRITASTPRYGRSDKYCMMALRLRAS